MKKRKKIAGWATTKYGQRIKVWRWIKTGKILPTNWKLQAGFLAMNG